MKPYTLITGAAGLLGTQHSLALASIGHNLILIDINSERLEQASKHVLKVPNT